MVVYECPPRLSRICLKYVDADYGVCMRSSVKTVACARNVLLLVAGLSAAFVRNYYSSGSMGWDTDIALLGSWFVHVTMVGSISLLICPLSATIGRSVFGKAGYARSLSPDHGFFATCILCIFTSGAIFFAQIFA